LELHYSDFIYVLAGILTGVINTIAGSGTVVSLGSMIWHGVPVYLANTTNRLGVFFQNIAAIRTYVAKSDLHTRDRPMFIIIPTLLGAMIGAFIAVEISNQAITWIASAVMVLMLVVLAGKLKQRVRSLHHLDKRMQRVRFVIFVLVGIYGGLIQIGIGILLLVAIMLFSSLDYYQANMVKLIVILIYTVPTVILFIATDMIDWRPAIALSIGQIAGAYLGGVASIRWVDMNKWIDRILIAIIIATLVRLWIF